MVISREGVVTSRDLEGPAQDVPLNAQITRINGSRVKNKEDITRALQIDGNSSATFTFMLPDLPQYARAQLPMFAARAGRTA
jgi:hypothetical protein